MFPKAQVNMFIYIIQFDIRTNYELLAKDMQNLKQFPWIKCETVFEIIKVISVKASGSLGAFEFKIELGQSRIQK